MKLTRDSSIISVKSLILNDAFLKHHYISIYEMIKLDLAKSKDVQNLKVLEIGGAGGISEIVFPNILLMSHPFKVKWKKDRVQYKKIQIFAKNKIEKKKTISLKTLFNIFAFLQSIF